MAKAAANAAGLQKLAGRHDLAITHRPVKDLIEYARNARTHSPQQIDQIAASMQTFGWTNPILLDENGMIIAGHGRVMAAKKLKLPDVPCIVLAGLSDTDKQGLVIADNRLAINAGWNNDMLLMELGEITAAAAFDLNSIGFSQADLDALLGDKEPADLMDPTDGEGQTRGDPQAVIAWGKTRVPLTAEEAAMLDRAYADHVAVQGVSYGFVRAIILGR